MCKINFLQLYRVTRKFDHKVLYVQIIIIIIIISMFKLTLFVVIHFDVILNIKNVLNVK